MIAFTCKGVTLKDEVDPRFGRCDYILFFDEESETLEAIKNESASSTHGAGIQAAQIVIGKGAKVVITGNCGPNAFRVLQEAGVKVFTASHVSCKEALSLYQKGKLTKINKPTKSTHPF